MVQAIIDINERTNYILNLIKARHNLRDKSSAIDRMAEEYESEHLEVRPEYWKKLERINKQKKIKVGTVTDLRARYEK